MKRNHALKLLTLLSLATLPLGTVACSKGSSPTEPGFDLEKSSLAASSDSLSVDSDKRHGSDDGAGDDNGGRGRGSDDGAGDDRGGRGRRGGRGGDDNGNNNPRAPRNGQEFEGSVASVSGNAVILTNGTRIIVNGQTQWVAGGDLRTLAQVSRSVAAGRPTRVEGRGVRQGNGNFVANTIKAEVDN
jgi:hypothetical protein